MLDQTVGPAARHARTLLVQAQATAAEAALAYAEARRRQDALDRAAGVSGAGAVRARAGEFAADELAVMWCGDPWQVRRLLSRCSRVRSGLPTVWAAHRRGEVDADQLQVIDRAARRAAEEATRNQIDARAVDAARTRNPRQLAAWLLRLVVECEPLEFATRHRKALSERRVTVSQGPDGMGWVTGELSATDVAQIDALLTALARNLGPGDERTEQQRRADLMADLLLGRLHLLDRDDDRDTGHDRDGRHDQDGRHDRDRSHEDSNSPDGPESAEGADRADGADGADLADLADGLDGANDPAEPSSSAPEPAVPVECDDEDVLWVEVEDIDLETGELLGTRLQAVTTDGEPLAAGEPLGSGTAGAAGEPGWFGATTMRRPRTVRIGVVVPLSSLLGLDETPAQLVDRSGAVPAEALRRTIEEALGSGTDEVLFTRLLTDDGGRLLDTTELGRFPSQRLAEAVALRAGTCRFPTCTVPPSSATSTTSNPGREAGPGQTTSTPAADDITAARRSPGSLRCGTATASTGRFPTTSDTDVQTNPCPSDCPPADLAASALFRHTRRAPGICNTRPSPGMAGPRHAAPSRFHADRRPRQTTSVEPGLSAESTDRGHGPRARTKGDGPRATADGRGRGRGRSPGTQAEAQGVRRGTGVTGLRCEGRARRGTAARGFP